MGIIKDWQKIKSINGFPAIMYDIILRKSYDRSDIFKSEGFWCVGDVNGSFKEGTKIPIDHTFIGKTNKL